MAPERVVFDTNIRIVSAAGFITHFIAASH